MPSLRERPWSLRQKRTLRLETPNKQIKRTRNGGSRCLAPEALVAPLWAAYQHVRPRDHHRCGSRIFRKRTPMHQGACHCGAVKLKLPSTPTVATSCNCSLCRRIGGPWVYFEFGTVEIEGHPENTAEYIQGDRTLRTIRCRTCGCVTHWEPLELKPGAKHGVHLGNFDPEFVASVRVRKFDGANTWKFFDELPPSQEPSPQGKA